MYALTVRKVDLTLRFYKKKNNKKFTFSARYDTPRSIWNGKQLVFIVHNS